MERSWDYLLKTPIGMVIAFACSILLLVFIVTGGLMMRVEMQRQRAERDQLREQQNDPDR